MIGCTATRILLPATCSQLHVLAGGLAECARTTFCHSVASWLTYQGHTGAGFIYTCANLVIFFQVQACLSMLKPWQWFIIVTLDRNLPRTHAGEGEGWGAEGRLPAPGRLCYESLQIARYQAGQHFRPHEVLALNPTLQADTDSLGSTTAYMRCMASCAPADCLWPTCIRMNSQTPALVHCKAQSLCAWLRMASLRSWWPRTASSGAPHCCCT